MDLFLDTQFESKAISLVCEYLGAFARNTVKVVNLNPNTFAAAGKSDTLKMPSPPFLVSDSGEIFSTLPSIVTVVAEALAAKNIFIGEQGSKEESQVLSVLETCTRKAIDSCIEVKTTKLKSDFQSGFIYSDILSGKSCNSR